MRFVEALVVARVLGVSVMELNPAGGQLAYDVLRLKLRYRDARANARHAVAEAKHVRSMLVAVTLADHIQSGRTKFKVLGSAYQFIGMLSMAMDAADGNQVELSAGLRALGIADTDVQLLSSEVNGDTEATARAYSEALSHAYPDLQFTDEHGGIFDFDVEGIDVDAPDHDHSGSYRDAFMQPDRLAHMIFGRMGDGG